MILDEISNNTNLNENEQQILKYITEHIDEVPTLSSRELARRTYTSSTAVLRCIKKLGFQNYNDFKLNINSYLKNYTTEEIKVSENDEFLDLMNKMTALNEQIIQQTKENLSIDTIKKVIRKLDKAKYIDIVANNENAAIAEYVSWNFCKLGKIVTVYDKDSKQIFLGMNATKEHAVIVITKYGENLNIQRMMKMLKKRRIPVISMTSKDNETMKELSDYMIGVVHDESVNNFVSLIYTTSLKYIFDLIYASLFSKHYDSTIKNEDTLLKLFERK